LPAADEAYDRLLTELYGEDPADFVARRAALVKELRRDEPELSRRAAGLRRPTVSVWAANRLREVAPDDLEALQEAGRHLREAQIAALEGRAVRDFRALLSAHSAALQRTVEDGAAFLDGRGQNVSEVVRQRLRTTLRAASLGEPELQSALAAGRLVVDLEPEGFGGLEGVVVPGPWPARPESSAPTERRVDPDLLARAAAARAAAYSQAEVAREATEEAQALRARARQLAEKAEETARGASEAEARARTAVAQAEALEREARLAEAEARESS
jgi:hypothetical protein